MNRSRFGLCATWVFGACAWLAASHGALAQEKPAPAKAAPVLKVGVTLHPYYSWTRNVVKELPIEVRPLLPGEVDAGNYQPAPEDIKKLADLDAIVVNGLGHDDFVEAMIKASGNEKLRRIKPNDETPLLKFKNGSDINSHTFISFTNAIQQTYAIARALGEMKPDLAEALRKNAGEYAKRLRRIKADAAQKLADAAVHRVVTVHDGYAYLLQEFGIELVGVVEPAHGLVPSAAELKNVIDLLKKEKVSVVFSEESFPAPLLDVVKREGHADVFLISHIATGQYADDKFEREMQSNVESMIRALTPKSGS